VSKRVLGALALVLMVTFALAGEGGSPVTQPIIDAIDGAGDGILGPIGTLLGILVTVAIGFAIVRTVRS
jgi:type IV secretory pathway VirB2 component (pilin)